MSAGVNVSNGPTRASTDNVYERPTRITGGRKINRNRSPVRKGSPGRTLKSSEDHPLMELVAQGDYDAVNNFISTQNFFDVDQRWSDGSTALMLACKNNNYDLVSLLLDYKARPNIQNDNLNCALHFSVFGCRGDDTIVKLLLEKECPTDITNIDGATPLHIAAELGYLSIVDHLLLNGSSISVRTEQNEDALLCAIYNGHYSVVERFIKDGVFLSRSYTDKYTALHVASERGNNDMVSLLLTHNADVKAKNQLQDTPLSIAAAHGRNVVVNTLITHMSDIRHKNKEGFSPLHHAAQYGHIDVVETLVTKNANVDDTDSNGVTPLMLASFRGFTDCVKKLLALNADKTLKNSNGHTAYDMAKLNDYEEVSVLVALDEPKPEPVAETPAPAAASQSRFANRKTIAERPAAAVAASTTAAEPMEVIKEDEALPPPPYENPEDIV